MLFAEVLLIPDWTQPSLSAEAIRLNGGVAPPPEPILPGEFVLQLYNPDQQVRVKQKAGSWSTSPSWEFEMPQQTFRQPSTSAIDRTLNDPVADELTPKIALKWKKDGKFGKDLGCFHSGKTINTDGGKKKNKEPEITVAFFQAQKGVTMYEPNLNRIEVEDMKGFEIVLLLSAIVIRDVYFGTLEQVFNISDSPAARKTAASPQHADAGLVIDPYSGGPSNSPRPHRTSRPNNPAGPKAPSGGRVPPTDPRSQWEIDAETARLKKEVKSEERERKRKEDARQQRTKKMLEAEEKEKKRKQAEIDKETERLKKLYGLQGQPSPGLPTRPHHHNRPSHHRVSSLTPNPHIRPQSVPQIPYQPLWSPQGPPRPRPRPGPGPGPGSFLPVPGSYPNPNNFPIGPAPGPQPKLKEKKSFFGFKRQNDQIQKKRSSIF